MHGRAGWRGRGRVVGRYGGPSAVEENLETVSTQRGILTQRVAAAVRDKEKVTLEKKRLRESIDELRRDHTHLQAVRTVAWRAEVWRGVAWRGVRGVAWRGVA